MRGRPCNIELTHEGKTQSLRDWAIALNLKYITLYKRYKAGKRGDQLMKGTK